MLYHCDIFVLGSSTADLIDLSASSIDVVVRIRKVGDDGTLSAPEAADVCFPCNNILYGLFADQIIEVNGTTIHSSTNQVGSQRGRMVRRRYCSTGDFADAFAGSNPAAGVFFFHFFFSFFFTAISSFDLPVFGKLADPG